MLCKADSTLNSLLTCNKNNLSKEGGEEGDFGLRCYPFIMVGDYDLFKTLNYEIKLQKYKVWTTHTWWAPLSSFPGGFFLKTNFFPFLLKQNVGFDCPELKKNIYCQPKKTANTRIYYSQKENVVIRWNGKRSISIIKLTYILAHWYRQIR